jgi:hypothetical protein
LDCCWLPLRRGRRIRLKVEQAGAPAAVARVRHRAAKVALAAKAGLGVKVRGAAATARGLDVVVRAAMAHHRTGAVQVVEVVADAAADRSRAATLLAVVKAAAVGAEVTPARPNCPSASPRCCR